MNNRENNELGIKVGQGLLYAEAIFSGMEAIGTIGRLGSLLFKNVTKKGISLWPAASGGRTVINGIEYTTHALERMQPVGTIIKEGVLESRGIPPSVIENAIKYGTMTKGNTAAEVVRTFGNVRVVTNPEGTRVITVL